MFGFEIYLLIKFHYPLEKGATNEKLVNISTRRYYFLLIIIILTGCTSNATQQKEPAVSDLTTQDVNSNPANLHQPRLWSLQPLPNRPSTPTTTSPTTLQQLTAGNIQNLQMISSSEFFELGALQDAEWSPDGDILAVITDSDFQIVDAKTLENHAPKSKAMSLSDSWTTGIFFLTDSQGLPSILTKDGFELNHLLPSDWSYSENAYAISLRREKPWLTFQHQI